MSEANKGFWSELLGVGDFYYELGVQIVGVCMATRPQNGGLIEVNELKRRLEKKRGKKAQEISLSVTRISALFACAIPVCNLFFFLKSPQRRYLESHQEAQDPWEWVRFGFCGCPEIGAVGATGNEHGVYHRAGHGTDLGICDPLNDHG